MESIQSFTPSEREINGRLLRHRPLADPLRAVQSAARMKVIDLRDDQAGQWKSLFSRRYAPEAKVVSQVSAILSEVQLRGDLALVEYTRRFDHADLSPQELAVTEAEIETAAGLIKPELVDALQASHRNVQDFAFRSLRGDWVVRNEQGAEVGERFDPLRRVGIYVPAGTAPLVSTAIMTVSLARAAGVSNIVVTSPVGPVKAMNPALLTALRTAGAAEIYKVGGAQAIAALAFGTQSIQPVCKVFGPGNAYVTEAKRQVFGSRLDSGAKRNSRSRGSHGKPALGCRGSPCTGRARPRKRDLPDCPGQGGS